MKILACLILVGPLVYMPHATGGHNETNVCLLCKAQLGKSSDKALNIFSGICKTVVEQCAVDNNTLNFESHHHTDAYAPCELCHSLVRTMRNSKDSSEKVVYQKFARQICGLMGVFSDTCHWLADNFGERILHCSRQWFNSDFCERLQICPSDEPPTEFEKLHDCGLYMYEPGLVNGKGQALESRITQVSQELCKESGTSRCKILAYQVKLFLFGLERELKDNSELIGAPKVQGQDTREVEISNGNVYAYGKPSVHVPVDVLAKFV